MNIYLHVICYNSFGVTMVNKNKEFFSPVLATFVKRTDGDYFTSYKGKQTQGNLDHCKKWFIDNFSHIFVKHGTVIN